MENTLYVNNVLDNDFEELVNEKTHLLKEKYDLKTLEKIFLEDTVKVCGVIKDIKPKSKMRERKKHLLQYFDYHLNHNSKLLNDKEIYALFRQYIAQSKYLMDERNYQVKDGLIFSTFFGLIMDLILFFVGISKYYYFIPICAFISFVRSYRRELKAKKEGKLLNF